MKKVENSTIETAGLMIIITLWHYKGKYFFWPVKMSYKIFFLQMVFSAYDMILCQKLRVKLIVLV